MFSRGVGTQFFTANHSNCRRLSLPTVRARTPVNTKTGALLMGLALDKAQSWLAKRREDLSVVDRDFIIQSAKHESKARAEQISAECKVSLNVALGADSLSLQTHIVAEGGVYALLGLIYRGQSRLA